MAHPGDRFRVRAEFPRGLGSLEDRSPAPEAAAFRLGRSLSRQRRRHAPGHAARARIAPAGRGAGHPVPGPAARRAPPRLRAGARAADAVHRRCPGHAAAPAAHGRQHLPGRLHAGTQPRPLERRYPARAGAPFAGAARSCPPGAWRARCAMAWHSTAFRCARSMASHPSATTCMPSSTRPGNRAGRAGRVHSRRNPSPHGAAWCWVQASPVRPPPPACRAVAGRSPCWMLPTRLQRAPRPCPRACSAPCLAR